MAPLTPAPLPDGTTVRTLLASLPIPKCLHNCPGVQATFLSDECTDTHFCQKLAYNARFWNALRDCSLDACNGEFHEVQEKTRFLNEIHLKMMGGCGSVQGNGGESVRFDAQAAFDPVPKPRPNESNVKPQEKEKEKGKEDEKKGEEKEKEEEEEKGAPTTSGGERTSSSSARETSSATTRPTGTGTGISMSTTTSTSTTESRLNHSPSDNLRILEQDHRVHVGDKGDTSRKPESAASGSKARLLTAFSVVFCSIAILQGL